MSKLTRFIRWLVVLAVPSTALGLLVQTPVGLDSLSTPEQTLLAVAWWLGIGLSGWLILSQFLFTAATLAGAGSLTARLAPFTLPIARRAAAGLASASITLATVGTPALAQAPNTGETIQIAEEYGLRAESTPTPQLQPLVEIETRPLSVLDSGGSYANPLVWLVRPGDHLWKIAGEHLRIVLDRTPTDDEHARYWAVLVSESMSVIRSGDPDLIYPGEQIPLPPTLDAGVRP